MLKGRPAQISAQEKGDGRKLNEAEFLRFLTTQDNTMTRDAMKKLFAHIDFSKGISFIEYLLWKYKKVSAPGCFLAVPWAKSDDLKLTHDVTVNFSTYFCSADLPARRVACLASGPRPFADCALLDPPDGR